MKNEILIEIQNIFRKVLNDDTLNLTFETSSNDIEEWDSLNHIQLVVEIEKFFNIKFTSREVQSWENIGQLIESIEKKKG
jgi:acyl carrier protein